MRYLIVSSHPRSGTHFLINTLLLNSKLFSFPSVRPSFLTLENLILPHDKCVVKEWIINIKKAKFDNKILIFKTHLTLTDLKYFINQEKIYYKERILINYIFNNSLILNIYRNHIDTLKSWYFFSKTNMVLTVNSTQNRLKNLTFSEFLRLKNIHKINFYKTEAYDDNVVKFLKFHHESWKKPLENILSVRYENLVFNHNEYLNKIFDFFQKNNLLKLEASNHNRSYILPKKNNKKLNLLSKINIFSPSLKEVYNKTKNITISNKDIDFINKNYN